MQLYNFYTRETRSNNKIQTQNETGKESDYLNASLRSPFFTLSSSRIVNCNVHVVQPEFYSNVDVLRSSKYSSWYRGIVECGSCIVT